MMRQLLLSIATSIIQQSVDFKASPRHISSLLKW